MNYRLDGAQLGSLLKSHGGLGQLLMQFAADGPIESFSYNFYAGKCGRQDAEQPFFIRPCLWGGSACRSWL
jgi:hypothetical protein